MKRKIKQALLLFAFITPFIVGMIAYHLSLPITYDVFTLILTIPSFGGFYAFLISKSKSLFEPIVVIKILNIKIENGDPTEDHRGNIKYSKMEVEIKNEGNTDAEDVRVEWKLIDKKTHKILDEADYLGIIDDKIPIEGNSYMSIPPDVIRKVSYVNVISQTERKNKEEGYQIRLKVICNSTEKVKTFDYSKI